MKAFNMPLRIDEFGDIVDADGQEVQFPHNTADHDEAIVKAVNYHDLLVGALGALVDVPGDYQFTNNAAKLLERINDDK